MGRRETPRITGGQDLVRDKNSMPLSRTTLALMCVLGLALCSNVQAWGQAVAVKEIHPGMLEGYLAEEQMPNSLALLPSPPKDGSAAFARDEEAARASFKLRGSARWDQAIADANLAFPAATDAFSDTLGFEITEKDTPHLYLLLRRTLTDAGLSTYTAKNHYQRKRPFMLNNQPIGTPDEEEGLRKDGSYPSGHTAIGWAWALILCETRAGSHRCDSRARVCLRPKPSDLQCPLAE